MIALHLRAPNSPTGNPQRLYLVVLGEGSHARSQAINEGYEGIAALHRHYPNLYPCYTVEIPRSEYHRIIRGQKS